MLHWMEKKWIQLMLMILGGGIIVLNREIREYCSLPVEMLLFLFFGLIYVFLVVYELREWKKKIPDGDLRKQKQFKIMCVVDVIALAALLSYLFSEIKLASVISIVAAVIFGAIDIFLKSKTKESAGKNEKDNTI